MSVIIENAAMIATVFFFIAFLVAIAYAFWPGSKQKQQFYSTIPLIDDGSENE
jgi:cbb3-type cytochrome oxidase subunit 3